MITRPGDLAGALRRAFDASVPYLINVITDVRAEYPRTTTGV
jgi:acetolactate synthase-1/2/3 large subunit